jgi:hypothetical protein
VLLTVAQAVLVGVFVAVFVAVLVPVSIGVLVTVILTVAEAVFVAVLVPVFVKVAVCAKTSTGVNQSKNIINIGKKMLFMEKFNNLFPVFTNRSDTYINLV